MSDLEKCLKIASEELRSCYTKNGIIAGTHHFTDYWARDGFFASLGSLAIKDDYIVKKQTELFWRFQRNDGLMPYRIMRGPISIGKYFGHPSFFKRPRPTYHLRGIGKEVLDGTTLTLLLTAILGLSGWKKAKIYLPKIEKALSYLKSREKNNLLWDGVMAEWNDTALKWGHLLYSNIIYWYMLDRLATWTQDFNTNLTQSLILRRNIVAKAIRNRLWNGNYFADWHDFKRQDYFYPFGNCLAIAWGLTNKKESESILCECKKVKISFTLETNSPKYPWWRIDPFQRLAGMGDYQNKSLLWWQPVASCLMALKKMGKDNEVTQLTKAICRKVNQDKAVYECYNRAGQPLKKLFYKSEYPFAWSAGILLWSITNNS